MPRLILLTALVFALGTAASAQITLAPGDIALTYVQADDPDGFAFVALEDIPAGTELFFADCGVQSDGTFRGGEGTIQYIVQAGGLSAGDEVGYDGSSPAAGFTAGPDGGAGCSSTLLLSTAGDQIVAYQTDDAGTTQYLYIVTTNSSSFQTTATNSNTTALPPGLTEGTTAVAVGAGPGAGDEFDNSIYDGSVQSGTKSELLAAIGDASNWSGSNELIAYDASTFSFMLTGGAMTVTQPLVFTTPGDPNSAAGWRHLSPPVEGFDIDDLAGLNLVQGVPAGTTNPQQYPTFGDNVLVSYIAGSGYLPPADTDEVIEPGQGFFWYLYDRTFTPNADVGNGTSTSTELGGFELSATGTVPTSDVTFMPQNYGTGGTPRYFLIGNPFDQDLNVAGITSTPTRQSVLQTWDPASGSYVMFEAGSANDVLAVWQGTLAELAPGTTQPTFTYTASERTGSQSAPFYGRPAPISNAIALRLSGQIGEATQVEDNLAVVRFAEDAATDWDRRDGSKLLPPLQSYALIAPVTTRDGSPWRTAVNTLPEGDVTVPVEFTTTGGGTFTIGADVTLMGGTRATLRDLLTGEETDLAMGEYTFDADATDWTDRFELAVSFAVVGNESDATSGLRLTPPRPNPASGTVRLGLSVGEAQTVRAAVYDALGREVAVLHEGAVASRATLDLTVDAASLAPGVYVVRAQGKGLVLTQRLTVTR